jgi:hypothetical protein
MRGIIIRVWRGSRLRAGNEKKRLKNFTTENTEVREKRLKIFTTEHTEDTEKRFFLG